MAHFAKIDNLGIVVSITVGRDEDNELDLCARTGDTYRQTSYNTSGGVHLLGGSPFRKNFAGIGFTYDKDRDAFIPPKPFNSWILNEEKCLWNPPVEYPSDGGNYKWNEEILNWELIDNG